MPASPARRRARLLLLTAGAIAVLGTFVAACDGDDASDAPAPVSEGGAGDASVSDASDASVLDAPADGPKRRLSPDGGRPAATACGGAARPAGDVDAAVDGGDCASDVECDGGAEGRCNRSAYGNGPPRCTYDACNADQDCPGTSSVCGCEVGWAKQNVCLGNSNCRIDADCPSGERCVFSYPIVIAVGGGIETGSEVGGVNYDGEAVGYFCTTPQDDCTCPNDANASACVYSLKSKRWECAVGP